MPSAPLRYCAVPHCSAKVTSGRCPDHQRASRHERGYTNKWDVYSKARLASDPFCVGYPHGYHTHKTLADVTDHIVSAVARPDLFWEQSNHQSLCSDCNKRKAIALEGGFGR